MDLPWCARRLNSIIEHTRDAFLPIDDVLAKVHDKKYFTTLDFASGYQLVSLDPDVCKYTSFLYDGHSFCVVPFGLNVSNAAFG